MFKIFLVLEILVSVFLKPEIKIEKQIYTSADFIETDAYGFLYVVKNNNLSKYNSYGIKLAHFQAADNKTISSIDVSNPLKITVFYKSDNSVVFLDGKLNPTSDEIILQNFQINNSDFVCTSSEGGFWVLNMLSLRLIKFNAQYKPEFERDLYEFGFYDPSYMLNAENKLFINFPDSGLMIFDSFGVFQKKISLQNCQNFQISKKSVSYFSKSENSFITLNTDNLSKTEITLADTLNVLNVRTNFNDIFIQTKEKILIGKIK